MTGVLNVMPEFTDNVVQNRLETKSWSLSTVILSTSGYWEAEEESGTDWERNVGDVKSFGIQRDDGQGIDREKVRALDRVSYTDMKNIFGTSFDFSMDFTEYMKVDTSTPETEIPEGVVVPDSYDGQRIRYGAREVEGTGYYFLVHGYENDYNVSVSSSKNFNDESADLNVDIDDNGVLDFGERQYTLDIPTSGIYESDGELMILQTSIQRIGRRVPPDPGEVVSIRRFSNIGRNVVRLDMRMWQR